MQFHSLKWVKPLVRMVLVLRHSSLGVIDWQSTSPCCLMYACGVAMYLGIYCVLYLCLS